jgi:outer membrane protein assembly factor BamB
MKTSAAEIICEYGPFPDAEKVAGVTYDGQQVWFGGGEKLFAFDPASGKTTRTLDIPAYAGTAFDGRHLYQIADGRIQKVDPQTGQVLSSIPTPDPEGNSGMAWAEGTLWVAHYQNRKIHQVDPQTGAILRTLESNRHVTGVTWVDGEFWHATWEDDGNELRRFDSKTGEVLEIVEMPAEIGVSGLESDGHDRFFCGGGDTGKIRVVRRPKRAPAPSP